MHTHTRTCTHTDARVHTHTYTHVHMHTMEYYSAIEKNELMPFVTTWMDLEIITLSQVGQIKTNIVDKYHNMSLIQGILKIIQMKLFTKQKQTHRHRKQTYGYQRGKGEEAKN